MGEVSIHRLAGGVPFYSLHYNGHYIDIDDEELCNGACLEFIKKHLKIEFVQANYLTPKDSHKTSYEAVVCEADDIGDQ